MPLKETLTIDLKEAMKAKDKIRKNVITLIRAAIKQREIDERIELTDEDILNIVAKQVKQRRESIVDFEKGDRPDLIDLTNHEIDILLSYLPEQLSEEELESIVKLAIEETGATSRKDMGKIMANVMPKIKGRADGGQVNKIVANYLQ